MKKLANLGLFAALLFLSSCATIFTGTGDRISFTSEPPGAIVFLDGIERCVTPCNFRVGRSLNERDVRISKEGYESRFFSLDREFNLVSILNFGNALGWGIDALSGAIFRFDPETYHVTLTPLSRTSMMRPFLIPMSSLLQSDLHVTDNPPPTVVSE